MSTRYILSAKPIFAFNPCEMIWAGDFEDWRASSFNCSLPSGHKGQHEAHWFMDITGEPIELDPSGWFDAWSADEQDVEQRWRCLW